MFNLNDERADTCSSCNITLSSQHSTALTGTNYLALVAWVRSLCLKLQTVLVFLICSTMTMSISMFDDPPIQLEAGNRLIDA